VQAFVCISSGNYNNNFFYYLLIATMKCFSPVVSDNGNLEKDQIIEECLSFLLFLKGKIQGIKVDEKKCELSMNVISYSYTCRHIHFSVLTFIEYFLCFRRFVKECLRPSILEIQTQMERYLNLEL
jgi:hypothetical protein